MIDAVRERACGLLLRASFIPPPHIRELRELARYRQTLVKEQAALANRVQKLIESADIKLGQVAFIVEPREE